MAQDISLKQWNEQPTYTNNFRMVSKYTDLGSADGKKSLLGVMLNISVNTESTATSHSIYNFNVSYRNGPASSFKHLVNFHNSYVSGRLNAGTIEVIKYLVRPLINIQNLQLQIKGIVRNDIGINDFGLIFRKYRDSNVVSLDD